MSAETLILFLITTLMINISPGPSVLFVTSVAMSNGIRAAVFAIVGMSIGIFVHVMAAASGLTALLAASETAFIILKYAGCAYLVYLGIKLLTSSGELDNRKAVSREKGLSRYTVKGILVDLLNPKIAIFFLAFLPQFVSPQAQSPFFETVFLGCLFVAIGGVVNLVYALTAAKSSQYAGKAVRKWVQKWIPGGILVGLGLRLVVLEE